MIPIEEWQLDAVESVLRRCDALSDFSSDQFMKTLEQMGFTIARRAHTSEATPATQNSDVILSIERAPEPYVEVRHMKSRGPRADLCIMDEVPVAEEPQGQNPVIVDYLKLMAGERPMRRNLMRIACDDNATHLPHEWYASPEVLREKLGIDPSGEGPVTGEDVQCMGCEPEEEDDSPACTIITPHKNHIWEADGQVWGCGGVDARFSKYDVWVAKNDTAVQRYGVDSVVVCDFNDMGVRFKPFPNGESITRTVGIFRAMFDLCHRDGSDCPRHYEEIVKASRK